MSYFTSVTSICAPVTSYATGGDLVRKYYFGFKPAELSGLSAQLTTEAHNQGWETVEGIFTWFEIGLLTGIPKIGEDATPYIRKDSKGDLLIWKSHDVPLNANWNIQVGPIFGPDSLLSQNLQAGDVIGVTVCALYAEWKLDARKGFLTVQANSI